MTTWLFLERAAVSGINKGCNPWTKKVHGCLDPMHNAVKHLADTWNNNFSNWRCVIDCSGLFQYWTNYKNCCSHYSLRHKTWENRVQVENYHSSPLKSNKVLYFFIQFHTGLSLNCCWIDKMLSTGSRHVLTKNTNTFPQIRHVNLDVQRMRLGTTGNVRFI